MKLTLHIHLEVMPHLRALAAGALGEVEEAALVRSLSEQLHVCTPKLLQMIALPDKVYI